MPKTAQDAFDLVQLARIGCALDANPEYLEALRINVTKWLEDIKQWEQNLANYEDHKH